MLINYNGYAERAIITENAFNVSVNEIITPGIHWADGDSVNVIGDVGGNYSGNFITVFRCNNIKGHKVDYAKLDENEEEYNEEYAAECAKYGISDGCNSESETIVENGKFIVVDITTESCYGEPDECGDLGIRIIKLEMI